MMRRLIAAFGLAFALFSTPALAQSIVVPTGGGSDCTTACTYTDTQTITMGTADHTAWTSTGGSTTGTGTTPAMNLAWTLNTSGTYDAVKWAFTCTSCANLNEFAIYGGASGTTQHFSVSRTGAVVLLGNLTYGAGASFCSLSRACLSSPAAGSWRFDNNTAATETAWWSTQDASGTWVAGLRPSATPASRIIIGESSRAGTDTNTAGANLVIEAGAGTGTATPTQLQLKSPIAVGSGTGIQTQTNGLVVYNGMALLTQYTVSGLPTCNAAAKGAMVWVTDATAPTYNGTLTGGGAVGIPAGCDGSAWHSV